jgi:hypothetical protein
LNVGVRDLAKTKTFHINKAWFPLLYFTILAGGGGTRCDKCGAIINGGRRKLNQHKKEFHSY